MGTRQDAFVFRSDARRKARDEGKQWRLLHGFLPPILSVEVAVI